MPPPSSRALLLAAGLLLGLGGCAASDDTLRPLVMTDAPPSGQLPPLAPLPPSRPFSRLFISGHSLTDPPFGDDLVFLARSAGTELLYDQQSASGASIRSRSLGPAEGPRGAGYSSGGETARARHPNVLDELRAPQVRPELPYDTLLLTERHDLLGALVWEDTLRHLRHFHDSFLARNPSGQTFFYEPWLSLDDRAYPSLWIDYERAAAPVWQCVTTRVNLALEAEGRPDRIRNIPAAWALAILVDRVRKEPSLLGASSAEGALGRLFRDDVHLTRLGVHFVAIFSFAVMSGRSPVGAPAPEGVKPEEAALFQEIAWDFASRVVPKRRRLSMAECRAYLSDSFIDEFWSYSSRLGWSDGAFGFVTGPLKRWRLTRQWHKDHFPLEGPNAFHDPDASDKDYWWAP